MVEMPWEMVGAALGAAVAGWRTRRLVREEISSALAAELRPLERRLEAVEAEIERWRPAMVPADRRM